MSLQLTLEARCARLLEVERRARAEREEIEKALRILALGHDEETLVMYLRARGIRVVHVAKESTP